MTYSDEELKELLSKEWYSVKEIGDMLGLNPGTIRRYVRLGKMRAIYHGMGSKMKIPAEDVKKFIEENLK